jgi:hypothetical protein
MAEVRLQDGIGRIRHRSEILEGSEKQGRANGR